MRMKSNSCPLCIWMKIYSHPPTEQVMTDVRDQTILATHTKKDQYSQEIELK